MNTGLHRMLGFDKPTLEQRLERTGHLWGVEDTIRFWGNTATKLHTKVTVDDIYFITDETYLLINKWSDDIKDIRIKDVQALVRAILTRQGF